MQASERLADLRTSGGLLIAVSFARAAAADDPTTILRVARALRDDDDLVPVVLHLVRITGVALRSAHGMEGAARVLDVLAEVGRDDPPPLRSSR